MVPCLMVALTQSTFYHCTFAFTCVVFFATLSTPRVSLTLTGAVSVIAAVETLCLLELWCEAFSGAKTVIDLGGPSPWMGVPVPIVRQCNFFWVQWLTWAGLGRAWACLVLRDPGTEARTGTPSWNIKRNRQAQAGPGLPLRWGRPARATQSGTAY